MYIQMDYYILASFEIYFNDENLIYLFRSFIVKIIGFMSYKGWKKFIKASASILLFSF